MTVKAGDLGGAGIVSGPYSHEQIKNMPGVYRMYNLGTRSAVTVVMADGRNLYCNDGYVADFNEVEKEPEKCKF